MPLALEMTLDILPTFECEWLYLLYLGGQLCYLGGTANSSHAASALYNKSCQKLCLLSSNAFFSLSGEKQWHSLTHTNVIAASANK